MVLSSPLARGRHLFQGLAIICISLIPACAGQTPPYYGMRTYIPSHPRLRGADVGLSTPQVDDYLSSPLARGRPICGRDRHAVEPLIPACAGQTSRMVDAKRLLDSHPRLRGADIPHGAVEIPLPLSSPLARGRRDPEPPRSSLSSLIPACAGQTPAAATCSLWKPSHPRLRGADKQRAAKWPRHSLSSPLARGRQLKAISVQSSSPLIPACAGQTRRHPPRRCRLPSHPRLRGADNKTITLVDKTTLSSPLARGRPKNGR